MPRRPKRTSRPAQPPRLAQLQRLLIRLVGHNEGSSWSADPKDFRIIKTSGGEVLVFRASALIKSRIWPNRSKAMEEIAGFFRAEGVEVECKPLDGSKTNFTITYVSAPDGYVFPEVDDD